MPIHPYPSHILSSNKYSLVGVIGGPTPGLLMSINTGIVISKPPPIGPVVSSKVLLVRVRHQCPTRMVFFRGSILR